MTARSTTLRINTNALSNAAPPLDHVDPFGSPRTLSDSSAASLQKLSPAALLPVRDSTGQKQRGSKWFNEAAHAAEEQTINQATQAEQEQDIIQAAHAAEEQTIKQAAQAEQEQAIAQAVQAEQEQAINERQWTRQYYQPQKPSVDTGRSSYDPEKAVYSTRRSSQPYIYSQQVLSSVRSHDLTDPDMSLQARKALNILLYLSGPCVLLSFLTSFWAMLSLLMTIVYQPFRICTPRLPFRYQMCHLLAPTLNLHLRCIYAQGYPRPADGEEIYRAFHLLVIHLLAPIISLGVAIAAWVVALYWSLARVVGDPSGIDKKDDGIEAVLGLTYFWEGYLNQSVKST